MQNKGSDIEERMLDFASRIGKVVDALPETRQGRRIANQLIRPEAFPVPNYSETSTAASKKDFVHKLGIVLKELG